MAQLPKIGKQTGKCSSYEADSEEVLLTCMVRSCRGWSPERYSVYGNGLDCIGGECRDLERAVKGEGCPLPHLI